MAYSKAYQTVVAGRTREDEAIGFFKKNRVATPAGSFEITAKGGKTQPTVDEDFLGDEDVGKNTNRDKGLKSAYNPNKYNGTPA